MRTAAAAVPLLLALAAAAVAHPPRFIGKEADKTQLLRQKDFLRLLTHVNQPLIWEDMANISKEYKIQPENYKVPHVAEEYLQLESNGELLPMGQPVSVLDEHHVEQMKVFIDLLYHAKDYDVLYKTALYLRDRVNMGLFVPAFYMVSLMHDETFTIILPPLHDVFPQHFVTSKAIQQVYDTKEYLVGEKIRKDMVFYVEANYTGYPTAYTAEQKLSYFTEDVSLNEFIAQFFFHYPYFLRSANYSIMNDDFRGNVFYHTMRQIFARYTLERLANGLPEVAPVDYDSRVENGYYPEVRQLNGIEFAPRPANVKLSNVDVLALQRVRNAEYKIYEALETGRVVSEEKGSFEYKFTDASNILGNIVQSTADSPHPRYYGALFRDLLSLFAKSSDVTHKYGIAASILGNFETMARDPVFYQILRRILNVFQQHKDELPPYTRQELEFPGLRIEAVDVDELVTYFVDKYHFPADNVVRETTPEEAERILYTLMQHCLDHESYNYSIKVSSGKPEKAIFRIFFGPRLDAYGNDMPLDVARHYFVETDRFVYQVPTGESEIIRSSRDSPVLRHDPMSSDTLWELVRDALEGARPFKPAGLQGYGFPERLALPRGSPAGFPLRLYVIASPLDEKSPASSADLDAKIATEYGGHFREWFSTLADNQHIGFPFDRRIPHYSNFHVPNSYMKDVAVYHKTFNEINGTFV